MLETSKQIDTEGAQMTNLITGAKNYMEGSESATIK